MKPEDAFRVYERTLRRIPGIHWLVRSAIWRLGGAIVWLGSRLTRFEVSTDNLLPIYKLQMLLGMYELDTVRVCRRLIKPGMIVVDIGAHVGYFTLLFARLVGTGGKVYAFEPHPNNCAILRRNIERRRLSNVTIIAKAVSDKEGPMPLYETSLSMGHSLIAAKPHVSQVVVESTSLDAFLGKSDIRSVNLVKVDAEGAEFAILDGMQSLVNRSRGLALILEFRRDLLSNAGISPEVFFQRLYRMGFRVFALHQEGEPEIPPADASGLHASMIKSNLLALQRN